MKKTFFWTLLGFTLAIVPATAETPATTPVAGTAEVASRYRERMLARDFEGTRPYCAADMTFVDPTTDVFDMPLAKGIVGRERILEAERSWQIAHMDFRPTFAFTSGTYDVAYGPFVADGQPALPLLNILRIEDGVIRERIDYGDYVGQTRKLAGPDVDEAGRRFLATAEAYLAAYAKDHAGMRRLLTDDATFQDPTAAVFGGDAADEVHGADAIAAWFARSMEGITSLEITVVDRFFSKNHAVFLTRAAATFEMKDPAGAAVTIDFDVPLVVALEIRDGRVTRHRDYWNAEEFLRRVQAARRSLAGRA